MANVKIQCPNCKRLLSADDKYLRYVVSCFACRTTFVFDSILIDGNSGTIPVFLPIDDKIDNPPAKESDEELCLKTIKHGILARSIFTYALKNNLCDDNDIAQLEDIYFCREHFKFQYSVLKSFHINEINDTLLKQGKHRRYYKEAVIIGNTAYFICSQWYDYNREPVIKWANAKNISAEAIVEFINLNASDMEDDDKLPHIAADGRNKVEITRTDEAAFFKTFNKSVFVIGITIPEALRETFLSHLSVATLNHGIPHRINVLLDGNIYEVSILIANQKNGCYFWRIQWSKNTPIAVYLQKKYPQVYEALENNPRADIPQECGILVKATNELDVFEFVCMGDDVASDDKATSVEFLLSDEQPDLTYSKPVQLMIDTQNYDVSTWKDLYIQLCIWLHSQNESVLNLFLDEEDVFETAKRICFASNEETFQHSHTKIADGIWANTNFCANDLIRLATEIMSYTEFPLEKIKIIYRYSRKNILPKEEEKIEPTSFSTGNPNYDDALEKWAEENL